MRFVAVLASLLISLAVGAQHEEWVRWYNGPGDTADYGGVIVFDGVGFLYVAGGSWDSVNADDYLIIKYSMDGDEQWVQRYNGGNNLSDHLYGIAVDGSGGVYVTGSTQVTPYPVIRHDYMTIKYDSSGTVRWVKTYDGPDSWSDAASAVAVDVEDNVYVTGWSRYLSTDSDYLTIAYDSAGGTLWTRRYWGPDSATSGYDYAQGIALDNDGNVYVTGYIRPDLGADDCATVKYNNAGDVDWATIYDGPAGYSDHAQFIAVDEDGSAIVAGKSQKSGGYWDYLTIKYDPMGDTVWVRRYDRPGSGDHQVRGLAIDDSGNVYVTGKSYDSTSGYDIATIKYGSDGEELWVSRYTATETSVDAGSGVALDDSGNVYVTGSSDWDCVTIKYNGMGEEKWVARYNGPDGLSDAATAVAVDDSGYVYVTGGSRSVAADYDCLTIKYGPSTGAEDEPQKKGPRYEMLRIFPNPFSIGTDIEFSLPKSVRVGMKIYDSAGRLVRTLAYGNKPAGYHSVRWDGSDRDGHSVSTGIYFCKFSAGDFISAKKMILLR